MNFFFLQTQLRKLNSDHNSRALNSNSGTKESAEEIQQLRLQLSKLRNANNTFENDVTQLNSTVSQIFVLRERNCANDFSYV